MPLAMLAAVSDHVEPKRELPPLRGTTFAERLLEAIANAGLENPHQLALKAGIAYDAVHDWVKGKVTEPRLPSLKKVAEVTGYSVPDLLGGAPRTKVERDAEPDEPPYPAWREFLRNHRKDLSDDERAELADHRRRRGAPSVQYYESQLRLLRLGFTLAEREEGGTETDAGRAELDEGGGRVVDRKAAQKRRRKGG